MTRAERNGLKTTACSSCGRTITWVELSPKRRIPLDASAPVFLVRPPCELDPQILVESAQDHYVSHFSTCPNATQHSKKGKS